MLFGILQWRVVTSQRDIAQDNLKFSLYERRYRIYDAARELRNHLKLVFTLQDARYNKITEWYTRIEEAEFYFSAEICAGLEEIKPKMKSYLDHLVEWKSLSPESNPVEWTKCNQICSAEKEELLTFLDELLRKLKIALRFDQLAKGM